LTLTAGQELAALDERMDYVFLLDISGSMGNDRKLTTSRSSLEAFIGELAEDDRFEVLTFNVQPNTLFGRLQPATDNFKIEAGQFMRSQQARGGTVLNPAMTAAYRYADPDRTLNVVVLSDGMTEQKERRALLALIASRPSNSRVFCIGVGNEVNRPLLEQMADDSGGLAAFISRGDNFEQQAKAFRRKLLHPVATDLELDIEGVTTFDVEPQKLPNLFHGTPLRIYGRYRGGGQAKVTLTGAVKGREIAQSAWLQFPARDDGNPEIERMWALKRIDRLQKEVERDGERPALVDEIVRLGESCSIVTRYTSFLVLENDAEYQRWKIERRNSLRMGRDRKAQARRQEEMAAIRDKALVDIGPQPLAAVRNDHPNSATRKELSASRPPAPSQLSPAPRPAERSQSRDLNFGTGPVGPLFVVLAAWLARRRKR
jgi:Ca-activated chloride channel family protein